MKTNLAKNTIMLSFCTILNKGLLFVMVPLFSRWLTTEEYGSYDVYATYVTLLIPIITLACSDALFRLAVDKNEKDGKSYYITNGLTIVTVNLLITIILILIIGRFIHWSVTFPFIALLLGETLDNYFQGYLRALKKLNIYAITKSVSVVATAVLVTVFVKVMNMGLNGIMYGYAFGFFLSCLFSIFITKWWQYIDIKKIKFVGAKELISYSYALIPNSISWWVINVSDRTIINIFLGATFNGIYSIAYKIPNLCTSVFNMFSISWQETATEIVETKERDSYFKEMYNSTIKTLLTLCSGIIACNFFFFEIVFDSKYYEGHLYSAILVASIIFSSTAQFLGGIQISLKNPKANGISTIIGAIVNIVIHLILIKFVGLYAAAFSTLISNMIVCFIRKKQLKNKVILNLDRKIYFYVIEFVYFAIMSMFKIPLWFNIINLCFAAIIFVIGNKEFINKILLKVRKVLKWGEK